MKHENEDVIYKKDGGGPRMLYDGVDDFTLFVSQFFDIGIGLPFIYLAFFFLFFI